jgi:hypothetical protein
MTRAARARKKANHRLIRKHPAHVQRPNPEHPDGAKLPVRCPVCRPAAKKWDRGQAGKAVNG